MRARIFFAFFVLCLTFGFSTPSFSDDKGEYSAFANKIGHEALGIITDKSKSEAEKNSALEALFVQNVDIDWVGKFVIGRSWKTATDEQRQKYMVNYKAFIIAHYTSNFAEFTDANFEVTRVVPDESGGNLVTMRIKRPQAEDIVVDYTIRKNDAGALKVYDITVEGVSMITTQRSDFTSVIAQNGLDYLIDQLGQRATQKEAQKTKS